MRTFGKYILSKISGKEIDPDAKYFVLRYDRKSKDKRAREALRYYASLDPESALSQALVADIDKEEDIKE